MKIKVELFVSDNYTSGYQDVEITEEDIFELARKKVAGDTPMDEINFKNEAIRNIEM